MYLWQRYTMPMNDSDHVPIDFQPEDKYTFHPQYVYRFHRIRSDFVSLYQRLFSILSDPTICKKKKKFSFFTILIICLFQMIEGNFTRFKHHHYGITIIIIILWS